MPETAAEVRTRRRGKLRIFFGASPGVGKTYAMLESAHARARTGARVLIGAINTHGRAETARLLQGLEILPPRVVGTGASTGAELDLEQALARQPDLLVVDELAHENASGSRHAKRWQDVADLVDAGIDVYTTLNVQHLESLNDIVTQITRLEIHDTVPDAVFESADEVELIDLPPEELLQRVRDGKVHVPPAARGSIDQSFGKGNLIALREMALRRLAERVEEQVQGYRQQQGVSTVWPTGERVMVCVGGSPLSARLIRTAGRFAERFRAAWFAVHVERRPMSTSARDQVTERLLHAERLGARAVTLSAIEPAQALLQFARANNVSRIIVGKPTRSRWLYGLRGSMVDQLVRDSGEIDVHVVQGGLGPAPRLERRADSPIEWTGHAWAVVTVAICTLAAWLLRPLFGIGNVDAVFLCGVLAVAVRRGRGPALLTAGLSMFAFAYFVEQSPFFVPEGIRYLLTLAAMVAVAVTVSALAEQRREQAEAARERESRTATLYDFAGDLARAGDPTEVDRVVAQHVFDVFRCRAILLKPELGGGMAVVAAKPAFRLDPQDLAVARWVLERGRPGGRGTESHPAATAFFLPLITVQGSVGALAVLPDRPTRFRAGPQRQHLEAFANQTALALERALLAEQAHATSLEVEQERLRNTLLSSVSHDLRTPIAAIMGAASTLLQGHNLGESVQRELLRNIYDASHRLNCHVRNLLDVTRLESGSVRLQREWTPVEEVIGAALAHLKEGLSQRRVETRIPIDLPPVPMDGVMIEHVLVNLLENALRHTPAGTPIEIAAAASPTAVTLQIADRGPGVPPGAEDRVFEKFYRAQTTGTGTGLGLAICRAIVDLHCGRIWVENRDGGGSVFYVSLPLQPPASLPPLTDTAHRGEP